jgi:hypothetical protein
MKIHLTYPGELGCRASRALSEALERLIPTLEVVSPDSVTADRLRWTDQIISQIDESDLALVCITSEFLSSGWLGYEIGVMAASRARIVQWLVDVDFSDLPRPLVKFRAIRSDAKSFRQLVDFVREDQQAIRLYPDWIEEWASDIERKIAHLVGGSHKEHQVRTTSEWLKKIYEARTVDQLQALKRTAEAETVTDQDVLRALLNAHSKLRDYAGVIDTFERFKKEIGEDPRDLSRYGFALMRTG